MVGMRHGLRWGREVIFGDQETIRVDDGVLNAEDVAKWQLKMQDFFCYQDRHGITKKALELKRARECNVQSIRALDGALASKGKCLKDFYAESMPTRIKVREQRELFPVGVLEEPEEAR